MLLIPLENLISLLIIYVIYISFKIILKYNNSLKIKIGYVLKHSENALNNILYRICVILYYILYQNAISYFV